MYEEVIVTRKYINQFDTKPKKENYIFAIYMVSYCVINTGSNSTFRNFQERLVCLYFFGIESLFLSKKNI